MEFYKIPLKILLLGTFELHVSSTWNPYLKLWNLPEALLGTCLEPLNWNPYMEQSNLHLEPLLGTSWNLHLEPRNLLKPLLGTLEPPKSFTWNPNLEPRNLLEPWLGTLRAFQILCLEPLLRTFRNLYLEPWKFLDPWLGTPTSEPCGMTAPGHSLAETPKLSAVGEKCIIGLSRAYSPCLIYVRLILLAFAVPPILVRRLSAICSPNNLPWDFLSKEKG